MRIVTHVCSCCLCCCGRSAFVLVWNKHKFEQAKMCAQHGSRTNSLQYELFLELVQTKQQLKTNATDPRNESRTWRHVGSVNTISSRSCVSAAKHNPAERYPTSNAILAIATDKKKRITRMRPAHNVVHRVQMFFGALR